MSNTDKGDNRVLNDTYRLSLDFYSSDLILHELLATHLSPTALSYMDEFLHKQGKASARRMNVLSLLADKNGPELIKRNAFGETINEIRFHPAYWELMEIAQDSQMLRVKWEPALRSRFAKERNQLGFSSGFLYAMSESGQYCPLCMTDGVALLLDTFCEEKDKSRLMPFIYSLSPETFYTGAMFLTEKAGGSDVGANLVRATRLDGRNYTLDGEKWFCSNVNADIIFVLARTDSKIKGTAGLSLFLVEKKLPDGSQNQMDIIRLKEKLGVRSMASAECMLSNTRATLVGNEFEGFKLMAAMMNLSRLYNSVAAVSASRRALIEAFQFLQARPSFGKVAIEQPLIRTKLEELQSIYLENFYLLWRTIRALDQAESGDSNNAALLRLLTPMLKKHSAESGVYLVRESMELMGGLGYIEDTIMPKLMRDVMVLPIWEGAGNIMVLDMLRALFKSEGFGIMCSEISDNIKPYPEYAEKMSKELFDVQKQADLLKTMESEIREASAAPFFKKLTSLYARSILLKELNETNKFWINPAVQYLHNMNYPVAEPRIRPLPVGDLQRMMGWAV
jgi:acyl-CoA dehydrogenase